MKILITTGIFLPEAGGPPTYILNFAQALLKLQHQVTVLTYSDQAVYDLDKTLGFPVVRVVRSNKILNYYHYYQKTKQLLNTENFDCIYAFDHFSAGYPVFLAIKNNKIPFFIRVGGDFIWERYLERTNKLVTLLFQQDIFAKYYDLPQDKLKIINNPVNKDISASIHKNTNKEIIFHGRINKKNNLIFLVQAFAKMQDNSFTLHIIGDGPEKSKLQAEANKLKLKNVIFSDLMSRNALYQKLSAAYLAVYPSLTDISPNGVLESLRLGLPFICTKEIGFDWLKNKALMFDPKNIGELVNILNNLSKQDFYYEYKQKLAKISYDYDYSQATQDTLQILQNESH
ncbi:MAG: Glycosyl transferase [Parcubacteria group bacterium GW2011_GWA2_36_10]|nr:MAG: Glycosyl transferase [Parcubacteria group bacterium GW2011_GWA2_36_10]